MSLRSQRLAASLKRSLAHSLSQKFPGYFITLTEVEVSEDSRYGSVRISILNTKNAPQILAEIKQCLPQLRSQFASDVRMRRVPKLNISLDESNK